MAEETDITTETEEEGNETWNLVLFPNIAAGEDQAKVKQRLATTLKVDPAKVEDWYHAEAPTLLLKEVEKSIAERYMEAILRCGATCNIQSSSESGGLSLVPKSRNIDFFVCPSCQYEEEIPKGTQYEQCPKCGLVIAKWEEKMKEERERDAIRRRLMRDKRIKGDMEEEFKRKREELERLRRLEREIMKELGIKPPGPFWLFFERHPFSVSSAFAILLIALSSLAMFYVNRYIEKQKYDQLVAAEPSPQIQRIAPGVADAVSLQQNGKQADLSDMATVTDKIRGESGASRERIVHAAQQMMKGVNAGAFVSAASGGHPIIGKTKPEPNGAPAVAVNTRSIGGIEGLTGVKRFDAATLDGIGPPAVARGADHVMRVLAETREIADPKDPKKHEVVPEINELDGSRVVDLMDTLQNDEEWDQFLRDNVAVFLAANKRDKAITLAGAIHSPVIRVESDGDIMVAMLKADKQADLTGIMTDVLQAKDKIGDPDTRARIMLALGARLAAAGSDQEPGGALELVGKMIRENKQPVEKAILSARLAVAELQHGDSGKAERDFHMAMNIAGLIKDPEQRILAFTRIAERYYDARNTALANQILSEAQLIAATQLDVDARSRAFAQIAIAQGYLGDMSGALISINDAGVGEAVQQLKAKLAESQIALGRFYQAQSLMAGLSDQEAYNRLEVSLIADLLHEGRLGRAKVRLAAVGERAGQIQDPAIRGMMLAQYGRLSERAGDKDEARSFFKQALGMSDRLDGRKRDLNRGFVALNQARSLMFDSSRDTLEDVKASVIKDPIQSEIAETQRVEKNLLPASARPKKKSTD